MSPRSLTLLGLISAATVTCAFAGLGSPSASQQPVTAADERPKTAENAQSQAATEKSETPTEILFPKDSWSAAGIRMEPVKSAPFVQKIELTGKIMINEEAVTHMFPLVEGRVEEVHVRFGQKVKQGDLLLVIQSREVGQLKLKLFQTRLQLDFAKTKNEWIQAVAENTSRLLQLIREGADIENIEKQLKDRPLGDYREQLLNAYIQNYRTEKHLERLSPLSKDGVVPGRQLLEAESEWKAARASSAVGRRTNSD
ncbi:MAG UNVERIFIED_CONTAM: HlyD family secretion protein [Planctomycetaceae bacterium]|jgi:cobalt-zinc-cadmium efflux system membrane fusion protein